jgi:hypothetical protein
MGGINPTLIVTAHSNVGILLQKQSISRVISWSHNYDLGQKILIILVSCSLKQKIITCSGIKNPLACSVLLQVTTREVWILYVDTVQGAFTANVIKYPWSLVT